MKHIVRFELADGSPVYVEVDEQDSTPTTKRALNVATKVAPYGPGWKTAVASANCRKR